MPLVTLAEELRILRQRRPELVEHHARRHIAVALVIQAAAVGRQQHRSVACGRQDVGQILARVDVADMDSHFVDAPRAHRVGRHGPVVRQVAQFDRRRMVGAHRVRIDQHLIGAVDPVSPVQDGQILIGPAAAEKVASTPLVRQADRVTLQHRGGSGAQRVAAGEATQQAVRVGVLRVDPGACLGRFLIFEPAVRVGDLDAVVRVDYVAHVGRRWWRHLNAPIGDGFPDGAGGQQRGGRNPAAVSQSVHGPLRTSKPSA